VFGGEVGEGGGVVAGKGGPGGPRSWCASAQLAQCGGEGLG
jgi:hypothetical protein